MGFYKKNNKNKINEFPFADNPDTACFTCCHVLNGEKPILYVSHDEDGYWQFLCGGKHSEDEARLVSLASILDIDESVSDLAQLDYGYYAECENENSDWVVFKRAEDNRRRK